MTEIIKPIETIGLAEYIDKVKQDLKQFSVDEKDKWLAIDEIEIEFSVVATREAGGSGKFSFKLGVPMIGETGVELGGEGKLGREKVQTVRIKLSPLLDKAQIVAGLSDEEVIGIKGNILANGVRSGDDTATGKDRA